MQSSTIEISNLTRKYGNFTAVDNLTLSIDKGEIFGLLGPTGAGKSTTILRNGWVICPKMWGSMTTSPDRRT